MALSLPGERPLAAASASHFLSGLAAWSAAVLHARRQRRALAALLDHDRLDDLGLMRQDLLAALRAPAPAQVLYAARATRARRRPA